MINTAFEWAEIVLMALLGSMTCVIIGLIAVAMALFYVGLSVWYLDIKYLKE